MHKQPITYLIVDTSSRNENANGGCDYCLVPMTAEYLSYVLRYMDEVRRLHKADDGVYSIMCWDAAATYLQRNERLAELCDIDGNLAVNVEKGEPILLTADPQFDEDDFRRVGCQAVQILSEDIWWTAYVRDTNIRIESAHVERQTLLRILRSLGGTYKCQSEHGAKAIPPSIQRIHDLLYLDMRGSRQFYDPDRSWDADTMSAIAEIVAEFIPRPKPIHGTDD